MRRALALGLASLVSACGSRTGLLVEGPFDTGAAVDAPIAETPVDASAPLEVCPTRRFPTPATDPGPLAWETCGTGCRRSAPSWAPERRGQLLAGPAEQMVRRIAGRLFLQYQRWTPTLESPHPPERQVTVIEPIDEPPIFAMEPMFEGGRALCGVHASVGGYGIATIVQRVALPRTVQYLAESWGELAARVGPRSRLELAGPGSAEGWWPVAVGDHHIFTKTLSARGVPLAPDTLLPPTSPVAPDEVARIRAHGDLGFGWSSNGIARLHPTGTVDRLALSPDATLRGWTVDETRGLLVWIASRGKESALYAAPLATTKGDLVGRRVAAVPWTAPSAATIFVADGGVVVHVESNQRWTVTDLDTGSQTSFDLPADVGTLAWPVLVRPSEVWFVGGDPGPATIAPLARYFYRLSR